MRQLACRALPCCRGELAEATQRLSDGVVNNVSTEPDEQLIVFVEWSQPIAGGRAQPTQGWGCEAAPEDPAQ